MANQTGIAIDIKAWLPTGKGLDEQFAALSLVKTAHETGDYAALLSASQDVQVKTESKTRRVAEPALTEDELIEKSGWVAEDEPAVLATTIDGNEAIAETPVEVQEEILGTALPNPTRRGRKAA